MTDQTVSQDEGTPEPVLAPETDASAEQTITQSEETAPAGETTAEEKPKRDPWWKDRIDKATAQKHAAERRSAELEAQVEAYRALLPDAVDENGKPKALPPKAYTEADVDRLADQKAAARVFNDRANAVADAARQAHADFDTVRQNFVQNFGEELQSRPDFLEAVLELPNGGEVYYELAKDMDKAADVLRMGAVPMALELARMSDRLAKPAGKTVSTAPAPIEPVDGQRATKSFDPSDPSVSMDEWVRYMDERDAKKRQRRA